MGSQGHFESIVDHAIKSVADNNYEEMYKLLTGNCWVSSRIVSQNIKHRLPDEYHNRILSLSTIRSLSINELIYLEIFQ